MTLAKMCMEIAGPLWWQLEDEDLRWRIEHEYGEIGPFTWDRINAGQLLLSNDMAWKEWEIFENITAAASGEAVNFSHVQPQDPPDLALGMLEMQRMAPHSFAEEVTKYIAASCLYVGVWFLPPPLSVAQQHIRDLDAEKGIERDYDGVAQVLKSGAWKREETAAQIQAAKVELVREIVREYTDSLARQLTAVPQLLARRIR